VATLGDILTASERVREADPALWEKLDRNRVRCYACGHRCPIPDGQLGVCKVRFNRGGTLYVPWGYVAGVQCDPIEKKPFFHAYPGALAYSFGMLGCDLHCSYCQNWVTSQALRDPDAIAPPLAADPEELVKDALAQRAKVVVSTYNEPLITSEWAVAVFRQARRQACRLPLFEWQRTPQVLEYLHRGSILQGRPQELDDRTIANSADACSRSSTPSAVCTAWASGSRSSLCSFPASTTATRTPPVDRISSRRLADILARHRFSSGLQNDFARRYAPGRPAPRRRHRPRIWIALHLRGNLSGQVKGLEDTHCHQCGALLIQRTDIRSKSTI